MNIHPLFVHFPIALLTVYALAEMLWFEKIKNQAWWWNVKALLLGVGTLGGFAALQTGEIAEEIRGGSQLIETHSTYAAATVWIFGILALMYVIAGIRMYFGSYVQAGVSGRIFTFFSTIERVVVRIAPLLACVGLVTLMITGALGGAIVYGPDTDPVVSFIYSVIIGN